MIPDQSIIEKGEEMIAIAKEYGAFNIRFFGEVVRDHARPNCGVDILVDVERGSVSNKDVVLLESEFSKILGGRLVGLKIPDMFIPPIFELILEEVVHLEVLLDQGTEHLKGTHIDQIVIEKRLEILVLAKRHGVTNVRLFGDIVNKSHQPDCSINLLVDIEDNRFDRYNGPLHLEIRVGRILDRVVNVLTPDMLLPPILQDYLRDAVTL
ncbi:MAG: hypothetical protein GY749_41205 [Desulfobacteraceae bacterium]|nr:hypothetical protein [Desulfobacteraceae bacterium]